MGGLKLKSKRQRGSVQEQFLCDSELQPHKSKRRTAAMCLSQVSSEVMAAVTETTLTTGCDETDSGQYEPKIRK